MEARTQTFRPRGHLSPRGQMYGVFDSPHALSQFQAALSELACPEERVEVLRGEEGIQALDADGHRHGLMARFLRYLQHLTDERGHAELYVRELLLGRYVVSVCVPTNLSATQLCQVYKAVGGRAITYYGPFVTEQLSS